MWASYCIGDVPAFFLTALMPDWLRIDFMCNSVVDEADCETCDRGFSFGFASRLSKICP